MAVRERGTIPILVHVTNRLAAGAGRIDVRTRVWAEDRECAGGEAFG